MICRVFFSLSERKSDRFKTIPGHSGPWKHSGWSIIAEQEISRSWQYCTPNNPLPDWYEWTCKGMSFFRKFASGLWLAKISTWNVTKRYLLKKADYSSFLTFLFVYFHCWLLIDDVIVKLWTEQLWGLLPSPVWSRSTEVASYVKHSLHVDEGTRKRIFSFYVFEIALLWEIRLQ